jgi:hypothetical protein
MFGEVALALDEWSTPADYSNMKPSFAHRSPTVPATFAAAIGISLSVFLLRGVGVQNEPTPFSLAIGGAAGRVAADLPAPVNERASEQVGKIGSSAQLVATRTEHFVSPRREAATKAHRVQRRAQVVGKRRGHGPSLKSTAGAPAPRANGHGKALGRPSEHHHGFPPGHAKKAPTAPSPAPPTSPKANGVGNGHKGGKK